MIIWQKNGHGVTLFDAKNNRRRGKAIHLFFEDCLYFSL
jgi:hypothetical protein